LDSLIILGHKTAKIISKSPIQFKNSDDSKVLKSVRMDTVRTIEKTKKKGVFGRLTDAISNKKETEREIIKIFYIVTYEKSNNTKALESPFLYDFPEDTNTNYDLNKIKNVYVNLRSKGEDYYL